MNNHGKLKREKRKLLKEHVTKGTQKLPLSDFSKKLVNFIIVHRHTKAFPISIEV